MNPFTAELFRLIEDDPRALLGADEKTLETERSKKLEKVKTILDVSRMAQKAGLTSLVVDFKNGNPNLLDFAAQFKDEEAMRLLKASAQEEQPLHASLWEQQEVGPMGSISERFLSEKVVWDSLHARIQGSKEASSSVGSRDGNSFAELFLDLVSEKYTEEDVSSVLFEVAEKYFNWVTSVESAETKSFYERNYISKRIENMYLAEQSGDSISENISFDSAKKMESEIQARKKLIVFQVERDLQLLMGDKKRITRKDAIAHLVKHLGGRMSSQNLLEIWHEKNRSKILVLLDIEERLKQQEMGEKFQLLNPPSVTVEKLLLVAARAGKLFVLENLLDRERVIDRQVLSEVLSYVQPIESNMHIIRMLMLRGARPSEKYVNACRLQKIQVLLKAGVAVENAIREIDRQIKRELSEKTLYSNDFIVEAMRQKIFSQESMDVKAFVKFFCENSSNPVIKDFANNDHVGLLKLAIIELIGYLELNNFEDITRSPSLKTLLQYKNKKDCTEQDNLEMVKVFGQIVGFLNDQVSWKLAANDALRSWSPNIFSLAFSTMFKDTFGYDYVELLVQTANLRAQGREYDVINDNPLFLQKVIEWVKEKLHKHAIVDWPQFIKLLNEYNVDSVHVPEEEKLFKTEEEKQATLQALGVEIKKYKYKDKEKDEDVSNDRDKASAQVITRGGLTGSPVNAGTFARATSPGSSSSSSYIVSSDEISLPKNTPK